MKYFYLLLLTRRYKMCLGFYLIFDLSMNSSKNVHTPGLNDIEVAPTKESFRSLAILKLSFIKNINRFNIYFILIHFV